MRRPVSITIGDTSIIVGYTDEPRTPAELAAMPYSEYLRTPEWRDRRRQEIQAAEYKCANCGRRTTRLQVHHLTYERRGNEHPDDLVVLCPHCHAQEHGLL